MYLTAPSAKMLPGEKEQPVVDRLVRERHRVHPGPRHVGEEVEPALGFTVGDPKLVEGGPHHRPAVVVLLHHLVQELLRPFQSGQGGVLGGQGGGDAERVAGLGGGQDVVGRPGHVADPEAGHAVGLREPVDGDGPFPHVRQRGEADVLETVVHDLLVQLVGDDDQSRMRPHYVGDGGQGLGLDDPGGGVVGRDQDQQLGLAGYGRLDGLRLQLEVLLLDGGHVDDVPSRHGDVGRVRHVVGSGQQHLVAGIQQGLEAHRHGLLGAGGDQDLRLGVVLEVVVLLELAGDGLPQLDHPPRRRVADVAGVEAALGGFDDVGGRRDVRLSPHQADDVVAALDPPHYLEVGRLVPAADAQGALGERGSQLALAH